MKQKTTKGFTLVELVIVMALLITTGGIIVGILSSTWRGSNKTRTNSDLAQNGDYALSLMTNLVINSQKLISFTPTNTGVAISDCTSSPGAGKTFTVLGFDGGATTLTCNDTSAPYTISSASAVFSAVPPAPTPFSTNSLLDTSQVKVTNCSFVCSQQDAYSPPRIDISFQLTQPSAIAGEGTSGVSFKTSITLRNQSYK